MRSLRVVRELGNKVSHEPFRCGSSAALALLRALCQLVQDVDRRSRHSEVVIAATNAAHVPDVCEEDARLVGRVGG